MVYRSFATRGNSSRAGDRDGQLTSRPHHTYPQWRRRRLLGRGCSARVLALACLLSVTFPPLLTPVQAAPPSYVYDDAGRLLAVIDPAGDTAVYTYDAVGNLLGISRQPSTTLAIVNFTPKSGPIGTLVTIYGTGFDPTPSQNTVTFNGTTAAVTSASTTQLVATVPGGATSGPIGVTTPSGSTTSAASFTVTSAGAPTAPPTITSFTPPLGVPGTAVTITGTHFSPTVADNQAVFTATQALVTASTETTITATTPSVRASGHITVATPFGAAVSTDDFFIPPTPYTAADVSATGRMTIGQSQLVTLSTANTIGLIVFDGTVNQRLSIQATGSTLTWTTLSVRDPYGTLLTTLGFSPPGGFVEPIALPLTGTYTILLVPGSGSTGSVTLTLHNVPGDVTGDLTPGGSAATVTTTTPGQNAFLNFNGAAGQRVSLLMTNSSFGSSCVSVSMLDPTNVTVLPSTCLTSTNNFVEPVTLSVSGTYTLVVNPAGVTTGNATFTLYDVPPDVTTPITPGGPAVNANLATPGQNARLPFTGAVGQKVFLLINSSTVTNCSPAAFKLVRPDGSQVATGNVCAGTFIDTQTLTAGGTYTVVLDPSSANTGQVTVTVYDVVDVTDSITPGGPAVTATITTPGQEALLSFGGTAGQRVSLLVNSKTFPSCGNVRILKPDGSTLATVSGCANSFIDAQTLPVTGTYSVQIDPYGADTGQSTVTLYDIPSDVTGTLVVNDPAVTVAITIPGQNGQFTFAGAASQLVTVRLTNNTIGSTTVKLLKPDGSVLGSVSSGSANFNMPQKMLPTTGTYTVTIDPSGSRTGSIGVQVTNP